MLTQRDKHLLGMLNKGVAHYDRRYNAETAQAPSSASPTNKTMLAAMRGNPPFEAEFDLDILIRYYTVAGGVFTNRSAAYILANHPTLANKLAFFNFVTADFQGGFKGAASKFPLTNWLYGVPFIYGKDYPITPFGVIDATVTGQLEIGDMAQVFYATVAGPVNVVALVITRCPTVSYGTLLWSLGSDMFTMNNIRYNLLDTTPAGLAQYRNQLMLLRQTFLGKFDSDNISPQSQKQPQQFQDGIVDVPIEKGVDKNIGVGSYINYDATDSVILSYFLKNTDKLTI